MTCGKKLQQPLHLKSTLKINYKKVSVTLSTKIFNCLLKRERKEFRHIVQNNAIVQTNPKKLEYIIDWVMDLLHTEMSRYKLQQKFSFQLNKYIKKVVKQNKVSPHTITKFETNLLSKPNFILHKLCDDVRVFSPTNILNIFHVTCFIKKGIFFIKKNEVQQIIKNQVLSLDNELEDAFYTPAIQLLLIP